MGTIEFLKKIKINIQVGCLLLNSLIKTNYVKTEYKRIKRMNNHYETIKLSVSKHRKRSNPTLVNDFFCKF